MKKNRVNEEYIYCYKCGTKNNNKSKKCSNKACKAKLHDRDHLYWDYLVEKWHEYLEDLGKDSVVGTLTMFFNYILYGTVLSISVITIASGVVENIVDKMNNEEPEKIVDYTNQYDDSSLINGCWYSEDHDDYWVIDKGQYRLKDKKREKLNYKFTKVNDKKVLTIILDDVITTGEYKWDGMDNFTFYFDNFEDARAEYKRIDCSAVPGEKKEEITPVPPTTTITTTRPTITTTTRKITTTTTENKDERYLEDLPDYIRNSYIFETKSECDKELDYILNSNDHEKTQKFLNDTCEMYNGKIAEVGDPRGYYAGGGGHTCLEIKDKKDKTYYWVTIAPTPNCQFYINTNIKQ